MSNVRGLGSVVAATSKVVAGAIGTTLLALVVASCGGSAARPPSRAELGAIQAVRASRQGAGVAVSSRAGRAAVACVIAGGGPPPGVRVPGRCETQVQVRGDGVAVVRFVETWDGHDFRGQGSPAASGLHHAWRFTVSRSGKVRGSQSSGDFPPQWVI